MSPSEPITLEQVFNEPTIVDDIRNLAVHWIRTSNLPATGSASVTQLSSALIAKLWERVRRGQNPEFPTRSKVFAFLSTCMEREVINVLRRRQRRPHVGSLTDEQLLFLSDAEASDSLDAVVAVQTAFEKLKAERDGTDGTPRFTEADLAVVRGKHFLGLTYGEIASMLDRPQSDIEKDYARVMAHLSAYLVAERPTQD